MTEEEVQAKANTLIRKYNWETEQYGYGIKLTVNDGEKTVSTVITDGKDIESEVRSLVEFVDAHKYGELDG